MTTEQGTFAVHFPSTVPSVWTRGNRQFLTFLTSPKCQFELPDQISLRIWALPTPHLFYPRWCDLPSSLGPTENKPQPPDLWVTRRELQFLLLLKTMAGQSESQQIQPPLPPSRTGLWAAHAHPYHVPCSCSWNVWWGPGLAPRVPHTCAI